MSVPAYKVLVVEDEKLIRDNLVEKIELCDPCFTVVAAASNGAEALALLRSRGVDVVLTDVRMPVMDGLTLAQQVRSEFPHVPVVIVSGYADFAYAQQAIHAGVEGYLLKPVKVVLLADTLSRIKAKLAEVDSRSRYELIREAVNGKPQETCITAQQAYQLLLLNIGNLCSTIASAATRNAFGVLWQRFDFAALRAAHPDGMLVDAPQPNGRYLVWPVQGTVLLDPVAAGQALFNELMPSATGISLNVACGGAQGLTGLSTQARALNFALSQSLVLDESRVLDVNKISQQPPAAVLDAPVYSRLTALITQGQIKPLKLEVQRLIDSALALKQSQLWMQDFVRQLIRLFQRHAAFTSEAEMYHAEYELFDRMTLPGSSLALFDQIWELLQTLVYDTSREMSPSKGLIDAIQSYIRANFNTAITLDEIARHFNFTPAYLIRIFKRQVGVTPIQYLIDLRMAEARRLMIGSPGLDIKEIGEIVGYPDPHYFSRIFKNTHGVTPTEYRSRNSPAPSKDR